jgi:hypothetical protein
MHNIFLYKYQVFSTIESFLMTVFSNIFTFRGSIIFSVLLITSPYQLFTDNTMSKLLVKYTFFYRIALMVKENSNIFYKHFYNG